MPLKKSMSMEAVSTGAARLGSHKQQRKAGRGSTAWLRSLRAWNMVGAVRGASMDCCNRLAGGPVALELLAMLTWPPTLCSVTEADDAQHNRQHGGAAAASPAGQQGQQQHHEETHDNAKQQQGERLEQQPRKRHAEGDAHAKEEQPPAKKGRIIDLNAHSARSVSGESAHHSGLDVCVPLHSRT